MERSTMDLWVGIFVIIGFGALLFLALKVGNLSVGTTGATYTVIARFDNIGGLKGRAPVRASGVVVGRVSAIAFDNTRYEANVIVTLDAKYKFPKDTTASILTSGILGENYVGLDAGGDSEMLKDGDKIQITQSAVVLERLIGQFLFDKAQQGADKPKADPMKIPDSLAPAKK